jgi:hypothetical protein
MPASWQVSCRMRVLRVQACFGAVTIARAKIELRSVSAGFAARNRGPPKSLQGWSRGRRRRPGVHSAGTAAHNPSARTHETPRTGRQARPPRLRAPRQFCLNNPTWLQSYEFQMDEDSGRGPAFLLPNRLRVLDEGNCRDIYVSASDSRYRNVRCRDPSAEGHPRSITLENRGVSRS